MAPTRKSPTGFPRETNSGRSVQGDRRRELRYDENGNTLFFRTWDHIMLNEMAVLKKSKHQVKPLNRSNTHTLRVGNNVGVFL